MDQRRGRSGAHLWSLSPAFLREKTAHVARDRRERRDFFGPVKKPMLY
jgi:hypothetical protein